MASLPNRYDLNYYTTSAPAPEQTVLQYIDLVKFLMCQHEYTSVDLALQAADQISFAAFDAPRRRQAMAEMHPTPPTPASQMI